LKVAKGKKHYGHRYVMGRDRNHISRHGYHYIPPISVNGEARYG
jgi:hypothetical protein